MVNKAAGFCGKDYGRSQCSDVQQCKNLLYFLVS